MIKSFKFFTPGTREIDNFWKINRFVASACASSIGACLSQFYQDTSSIGARLSQFYRDASSIGVQEAFVSIVPEVIETMVFEASPCYRNSTLVNTFNCVNGFFNNLLL